MLHVIVALGTGWNYKSATLVPGISSSNDDNVFGIARWLLCLLGTVLVVQADYIQVDGVVS